MDVINFNRKHNIKTKEKVLEAAAQQRQTYFVFFFSSKVLVKLLKLKEKITD